MRKDYISPSLTEIYIETECLLDGSIIISDREVDTKDQLTSSRRGEWGNLWVKP